MDFAKSISKDEYIKMFENEIASKEITREKVHAKLKLQNQSDAMEVKRVYDMIRYVMKRKGNVSHGKGDAAERVSEEANQNFSTGHEDPSWIAPTDSQDDEFSPKNRNCSHSYQAKDIFLQKETKISSINIWIVISSQTAK